MLQGGDRVAGQQPGKKGPGGTDGQQSGHEAAVCSGGQEGQWLLAWIRNGVASKTRAVILPLYSEKVGQHLECAVSSFEAPLLRKGMEGLESVQSEE